MWDLIRMLPVGSCWCEHICWKFRGAEYCSNLHFSFSWMPSASVKLLCCLICCGVVVGFGFVVLVWVFLLLFFFSTLWFLCSLLLGGGGSGRNGNMDKWEDEMSVKAAIQDPFWGVEFGDVLCSRDWQPVVRRMETWHPVANCVRNGREHLLGIQWKMGVFVAPTKGERLFRAANSMVGRGDWTLPERAMSEQGSCSACQPYLVGSDISLCSPFVLV